MPTKPYNEGLISDAQPFFVQQVAFLGILYVMPENIFGWSDEQKNQDRIGN